MKISPRFVPTSTSAISTPTATPEQRNPRGCTTRRAACPERRRGPRGLGINVAVARPSANEQVPARRERGTRPTSIPLQPPSGSSDECPCVNPPLSFFRHLVNAANEASSQRFRGRWWASAVRTLERATIFFDEDQLETHGCRLGAVFATSYHHTEGAHPPTTPFLLYFTPKTKILPTMTHGSIHRHQAPTYGPDHSDVGMFCRAPQLPLGCRPKDSTTRPTFRPSGFSWAILVSALRHALIGQHPFVSPTTPRRALWRPPSFLARTPPALPGTRCLPAPIEQHRFGQARAWRRRQGSSLPPRARNTRAVYDH